MAPSKGRFVVTIEHKSVLNTLLAGRDLEPQAVEAFVGAVMDGAIDDVVVAAFLAGLRAKGETGSEVAAAARAMRKRSVPVEVEYPGRAVDTCGTGGDGAETINISTAAAVTAAAAGAMVAKHGNRSVSSRCGSADVLEAAGVTLDLTPAAMAQLHDELGISFLFAPRLHPAMRAVMPVRRSMGVRTVFNLLGPLTNPARVQRQVIGVWGRDVQPLMAAAIAELGAQHALVVHSDDGLDELSVTAPTTIVEVRDGKVIGETRLDPGELGIVVDDHSSLRGGDAAENLRRLQAILSGEERSAASEAVALNTAAALYVAGVATGLGDGLEQARTALHTGAALERLQALADRSAELANGV
jgi:anthranilate phosphoribosyltransferase